MDLYPLANDSYLIRLRLSSLIHNYPTSLLTTATLFSVVRKADQ